jgi:hypothetical protein
MEASVPSHSKAQMFQNDDGRLEYSGKNAHVLWPGPMKPGLWMVSSRAFLLAAVWHLRGWHASRSRVQAWMLPMSTVAVK